MQDVLNVSGIVPKESFTTVYYSHNSREKSQKSVDQNERTYIQYSLCSLLVVLNSFKLHGFRPAQQHFLGIRASLMYWDIYLKISRDLECMTMEHNHD